MGGRTHDDRIFIRKSAGWNCIHREEKDHEICTSHPLFCAVGGSWARARRLFGTLYLPSYASIDYGGDPSFVTEAAIHHNGPAL